MRFQQPAADRGAAADTALPTQARRFRINDKELREFGFTDGCPQCAHVQRYDGSGNCPGGGITTTELEQFKQFHAPDREPAMEKLRDAALNGVNTFDALMECARVCSLGQVSQELYHLGGQYRRNA